MSERLLPFDWDAFEREPMRVRFFDDKGSFAPLVAGPALGSMVAAHWDGFVYPTIYAFREFHKLRLAAPEPQKVRVRLYRDRSIGLVYAAVERPGDLVDSGGFSHFRDGQDWCSDIVEIEVKEQ